MMMIISGASGLGTSIFSKKTRQCILKSSKMTFESATESLAVSALLSSHPMKDKRSESSSFTTSLGAYSLCPCFTGLLS